MTPDELHSMMTNLVREHDEMRDAIQSWGEIDATAGRAAISGEIRDRVERLQGMMRHASNLINGIDDVVKLLPADISPEIDGQRALVLADRAALLSMWSDLAGFAEKLNEALVALSRSDNA